jgi:hypothetical protein
MKSFSTIFWYYLFIYYHHGMCFRVSCVFVSSILFWFPQRTHYFWRVLRFLFMERKQDYNVTSVKNVKVYSILPITGRGPIIANLYVVREHLQIFGPFFVVRPFLLTSLLIYIYFPKSNKMAIIGTLPSRFSDKNQELYKGSLIRACTYSYLLNRSSASNSVGNIWVSHIVYKQVHSA